MKRRAEEQEEQESRAIGWLDIPNAPGLIPELWGTEAGTASREPYCVRAGRS